MIATNPTLVDLVRLDHPTERGGPLGTADATGRGRRRTTDGTGVGYEQSALRRLFASSDGREGVAAFLAKRDPRFEGR